MAGEIVGDDSYIFGDFVDRLVPEGGVIDNASVFAMSLSATVFRAPTLTDVYEFSPVGDTADIYLDGVYSDIAQGDTVIVEASDGILATAVTESQIATVITTTQPALELQVTKLSIHPASAIEDPENARSVRVWFNARKAGTLERIPTKTVTKSHILHTPRPVTLPPKTTLPPTS